MKFFSIDTRMTLISSVSRYFPKWYFTKMFQQKRTKGQSEQRIKVKTFRPLRVLNVIQATNTITFTGNNNRHSSRTALNPKVLQNRVRVGGERSSQLVLFTLASRVNPQRVKYSTGVEAEQIGFVRLAGIFMRSPRVSHYFDQKRGNPDFQKPLLAEQTPEKSIITKKFAWSIWLHMMHIATDAYYLKQKHFPQHSVFEEPRIKRGNHGEKTNRQ